MSHVYESLKMLGVRGQYTEKSHTRGLATRARALRLLNVVARTTLVFSASAHLLIEHGV